MKMDRLLEYKILKAWNDLKKERKVNGFASTKLHVHVKIKEMSADEDHSVLEREIIDELKELEEIHQFEELHHQRVFQNRLEDWTRKHETCEKIKAEQKRVYEEEKAKSPFGITGLPSKNKLQRQDLSSLASLDVLRSERDLAIPRKSKNEIPELPWVGNVFEEPQPEMAPPRPFKEEHAKMNIQKVKKILI